MVNVVLDTNVLAAALLTSNGVNRECLTTVFGNPEAFNVCYSSQIMDEYEDVLNRPVITSMGLSDNARELIAVIREFGEQIIPKFLPALVNPDHKDKPFLEAVVYVDGVLITNNLKDFPFVGANICAPQQFMDWYRLNT